eukprot:COSAG05_NODE_1672_length_4303_cov_1.823026_2_plen_206_part_00
MIWSAYVDMVSDESQLRLMSGMEAHFAGPPQKMQGHVQWTFYGTAKADGPTASRVTTVPIKPGSQASILATLNSAEIKAGLQAEVFSGLIEVSTMMAEDNKLVARSIYTTMEALTVSDDAQSALLMEQMKEHFAGPPETVKGIVPWSFGGTSNLAFKAQMQLLEQPKFGAVVNLGSQVPSFLNTDSNRRSFTFLNAKGLRFTIRF